MRDWAAIRSRPLPSINSFIARLVHDYPIKSCTVVSRIRQANRGRVTLVDGCYVMGHCSSNLYWITRRTLFGKATLLDQDMEIDFHPVDDLVTKPGSG
ncbi:MAG: hypothetical protein GPOALKHO_001004 [Sodalis sp.]|nr:MAG: hypothetical protein GPOALKHO_001004 [Sodalis sp.]